MRNQRTVIEMLFKLFIISSAVFLISSAMFMPRLDKSSFTSAFSVLNALPLPYWMGLYTSVLSIILCCVADKSRWVVFAVLISVMYIELPRFAYANGFQVEYFHQAQVYHVLNEGSVTDPNYPFPKSDVSHAIFSAIYIMVGGFESNFLVSHVIPIIFKLILSLVAASLVTRSAGKQAKPFLLVSVPLYIVLSDTEPSFTNHYIFVLPLYVLMLYSLFSIDDDRSRLSYILFLIIFSTVIFSHIYFATLITLSIASYIFFMYAMKKSRYAPPWTLTPIVIFLLWHGYSSGWSIQKFYAELNYLLLPAIDRVISFDINPLGFIQQTSERFGSIPIKAYYQTMAWLKLLIVAYLNIFFLLIIIYSLFYSLRKFGRNNILKIFLTKSLTNLWFFSGLFLLIYAFTVTAHPQRVLEAFITSNAGIVLLITKNLEKMRGFGEEEMWNSRKIYTSILLSLVIVSAFSIPLKVYSHWGTAETYIGLTEKSISQTMYITDYGDLSIPIYHVGPTPYYFISVISEKGLVTTIDITAPEGGGFFNETLSNINYNLATEGRHYIFVSISNMMALKAKYEMEQYFKNFTDSYLEIVSKTNLIYMNSVTETICYVGQ